MHIFFLAKFIPRQLFGTQEIKVHSKNRNSYKEGVATVVWLCFSPRGLVCVIQQVTAGLRSGYDLMGAAGKGPHVCMTLLPEKRRSAWYATAARTSEVMICIGAFFFLLHSVTKHCWEKYSEAPSTTGMAETSWTWAWVRSERGWLGHTAGLFGLIGLETQLLVHFAPLSIFSDVSGRTFCLPQWRMQFEHLRNVENNITPALMSQSLLPAEEYVGLAFLGQGSATF